MNESPVAIITGAGSGIGRAAALLLAECGYRTVLVARARQALEQTARDTAARRPDAAAHIHPADLADAQAPRAVVAAAVERFGRIDVLLSAAGNAPLGSIGSFDADTVQQTVAVNLTAPAQLAAAAWPTFHRQRSGLIIHISSMAAFDPFPGFNIYAAAKAGLNMLTHTLAREGDEIGVRTLGLAPGAVETPMLRRNFDEQAIPREKTLDPMHVAAIIRDCITGAHPFTSGQTLRIESP